MKIDLNKVARKIEVNNHISLVTTTASPIIFSVRPAYIEKRRMLLICISCFLDIQDYQASLSQARLGSRKRLRSVINELESLKPEFDRQVDELNREDDELHRVGSDFPVVSYSSDSVEWPPVHRDPCSRPDVKKTSQPSSTYNNSLTSSSNRTPIDQQFQKLSSDFLPPNQATLSRHSFLGPNGLKSQWVAPSRIKVQYPSKYRLGFY
ncbi:AMSH-like ubiquitin thioesterase 3 isoform X2 [Brassica rapa]|uniref:AMSH-like ubiquitin thioesterase 3 isoform X2 n=1 Tax=Brassica campestris TaxID=3711 RepID=UPI00142E1FF1|nr:AMSH-like ubiquitin thioesterase 3 isoform X2 [Brassica rapa]